MGKTFALRAAASCDYSANLLNLWNLPLQRLQLYSQPFARPADYFRLSPQATCIGPAMIGLERHLAIIEETIPFRILTRKEYLHLLWQRLRGPVQEIDETAVVLMDYLNIQPNFFHWFLDALPRIFAAEVYELTSIECCRLIVPSTLKVWQWEALRFLGVAEEQIIRFPVGFKDQGCRLKNLISTFSHRHIRSSSTGHFDAFSPGSIRSLSDRLWKGVASEAHTHADAKRLYISRGNVNYRRVLNEDVVMDFLAPFGFHRVNLDSLSLSDQIHLFHSATHIIAPHGGALTNLIHVAEGTRVLEIFQLGHGIRPDFFQLAALKGALYSFNVAPSLNANHDIEITPPMLRTFLDASL